MMRRALQRANTFHTNEDEQAQQEEHQPQQHIHSSRNPQGDKLSASSKKGVGGRRKERAVSKNGGSGEVLAVETPLHAQLAATTPLHAQLAATTPKKISRSAILAKISLAWSKPLDQTPLSCDLPRLASRVVIQDRRAGKNLDILPKDNDSPQALVKTLLSNISLILNEPPKNPSDPKFTTDYSSPPLNPDLKKWTEELLHSVGQDSRTVGVCKLLTQVNILPVAHLIKAIVFTLTNNFTKDVKTPDGWRIILRFSDDEITCTHIRKEVSLSTGTSSFEFEWNLAILFPDKGNNSKVDITISGLVCHPDMPKDFKTKLTQVLSNLIED